MSRVLPAHPAEPLSPAPWRWALLQMVLALLALLLLYRETALAMVGIWQRSDTFAHAFVVPPIALWLIWRRRDVLAALRPVPDAWFLLPLALAGLAWLLGELVAVNALTQLALVAQIALLVPLLWGRAVARRIRFPLLFLFFAVPVGEFMLPTLMELTADFTVVAVRLSGVPVYREGLQFIIPSGSWSVVEACSGLRYLMASLMVGTLFAYLSYHSLRRRLIFVAVSLLIPLLGNWVRAYLIVMLGHVSGNELATGADHLVYGWVFFGILMLAMFMIGARWTEDEVPPAPPAASEIRSASPAQRWLVAILGLTALAVPSLLQARFERAGQAELTLHLAAPELGAWQKRAEPLADWQARFVNPRAELQTVYERADQRVGLHLAYYRQQGYDSKLLGSHHQLLGADEKRWAQLDGRPQSLSLAGQDLELHSVELRAGSLSGVRGQRLRVWQFFWVHGRLTASPVRAKAWNAWQRLSGQGDDAASVIVYTEDLQDNGEAAEQRLRDFLQQNWGAIAAQLDKTAAQ